MRGRLLIKHILDEPVTLDDYGYMQKNVEHLFERTGMPDIFKDKRNFDEFLKSDRTAKRNIQWDYLFLPKLTEILKEKSSGDFWEIDKLPNQKIWVDNDSKWLLNKIESNLPNVHVYDHGKGLELIFSPVLKPYMENERIRALPACGEFFFRDWDHDGICVKSSDIFVKEAFEIISPRSVEQGDVEDRDWIDEIGRQFETTDEVARYLIENGVGYFSGCPPGNWYETGYITNPEDDTEENRTFHIHNASKKQEIDIFKKTLPEEWEKHCQ